MQDFITTEYNLIFMELLSSTLSEQSAIGIASAAPNTDDLATLISNYIIAGSG